MAYDDVQDLIDQGRQLAADELGPPYDVYRLVNSDVKGNVFIPLNKIASSINMLIKIGYGSQFRISLETEKQMAILWYDVIADMSPFQVGDIFVLNDPVYGPGSSSVAFANKQFKGFSLADHSPGKKSIGGRLDITATFSRLNNLATTQTGRNSNVSDNALPFVLNNGKVNLGSVGDTPTSFPIGLISTVHTYGDRTFNAVPGEQRKSGWMAYVPPIQGLTFKNEDRMITADGVKFTIQVPYTQLVGASGSQLFLELENS